jgi:L-arabinose isomerase
MNQVDDRLRIGLMGIGLEAYWKQFKGLEERLQGYLDVVAAKITSNRRSVVQLGLIDTPQKACSAGHECRRQDIDVLVIYATTYALSSTVLPVVLRAKVPVLLLNLQPEAAIRYAQLNSMGDRTAMTGEWLAYCNACPVPEIANVLTRLGIPFFQATGMLHDDPECWTQIEAWMKAAAVAKALSHSRMGLMGHYYSGMLDIATDLAQVSGRFGIHVEIVEVDQLTAMRRGIESAAISSKIAQFEEFFRVEADCPRAELERAAKTAVALDQLVAENDLQLMAYYYMGTGVPENEDTMSSIILGASMLTGRHVPVAGEYEVKNVIAMKIMDLLGAGGSFTEYYAMDFSADLVLMGHDGPGHIGIAQDKIRVRPLRVYHGKVGAGLSVEMSVRYGAVTLLSVVEDPRCGFKLLVAEGESVPGEILELGNTNSRYRFSIGARRFAEEWNAQGPAHHCAIGVGHHGAQLAKLAAFLQLGFKQVC